MFIPDSRVVGKIAYTLDKRTWTCLTDFDDMTDGEKNEYNNLMRDLTNGNTDALNSAKDNMQFSSGLFNINFSFYTLKM